MLLSQMQQQHINILLIAMNLMSSKLLRSSKPVVNRSLQTMQAYSCQLFIDSFKVSHRGFVYFLWYTHSTQISSLRYESQGKTVPVKETLTVSVRVTFKNGKEQPLNTYLKLMTEGGEELDQFQLPVSNLTTQFKDIELPMDRGLCVVKARRKQMNISEQQQQTHLRGMIFRSKFGKNEGQSFISGQYQSLQEELNRIKKQLEDEVYLNNKLKNDRDVLLATKQELQIQIETLVVQITRQIQTVREYYDNKITIREHCYEEEIENLVNMFNSDNGFSKKVLDTLMKQKIKAEDQLKNLQEKMKSHQEAVVKKDHQIKYLEDEVALKLSYIQKIQGQLKDKNKENQTLMEEKKYANELGQTLEGQVEQLKQKVSLLDQQLQKTNEKNQELEFDIKNKEIQIKSLEESIQNGKQKEEGNLRQNELLKTETDLLTEEKKNLNDLIDNLKAKLQECEYEMEFNQNVMGQLKIQQQQKEEELYLQLENLEKIYQKKIEDILSGFQGEREKILTTSQAKEKEKDQMEGKIKDLQNLASESELKIKELSNEMEQKNNEIRSKEDILNEKLKLIAHLEEELKKFSEELVTSKEEANKEGMNEIVKPLKSKIKSLEEQNIHLKTESQKRQSQLQQRRDMQSKLSKSQAEKKLLQMEANNIEGLRKQIERLSTKIGELERVYFISQLKIDKILQMYPEVDLKKVNLEVPQLEQCASEIEEEIIMNKKISQSPSAGLASSAKKKGTVSEKKIPTEDDVERKSERKLSPIRVSIEGMKDNISQKSGTSWVRVSHSKKLKDLEQQNQELKKRISELQAEIKDHTRRYSRYKHEVAEYEKMIALLKGELTKLNDNQVVDPLKQTQNITPTFMQPSPSQLNTNQLQPNQPQNPSQPQQIPVYQQPIQVNTDPTSPTFTQKSPSIVIQRVQKVNKQSQVFLEDDKFKELMKQSQMMSMEIENKSHKINQLQGDIKQAISAKREQANKLAVLEKVCKELEDKQKQLLKYIESLVETNKQFQKEQAALQQSNRKLEEQNRKQKQDLQEAKLALKELNIHFQHVQSQSKRLKSQNQSLEDKVQKGAGNQFAVKQLTREIEDLNKKNLQLLRTINHLKLEKDSVDEQLRMLKKRQNDHMRIASEWEEKAASLERQIQEMKRKQNKLKRQIQDSQEDVKRTKLQQKKLEDQYQALSTAQIGWQVERRKYLDQISNLQDQMSRKDYELTKMNKEIDRWKAKAEEKDDYRLGKKNQMRDEIERLENQLIRREKRVFEQAEQNKLLRGRLQLLERQNKRMMEQKNHSYSEKLRYYVDQMGNIKKLLEEYQNENSRLKIDNTELYEQSQMLKINYDKLQMRYDENIGREEDILHDLQLYIDEGNNLKQKLKEENRRIVELEGAFTNVRKEADEEKNLNKKVNEKLQASQRNLEIALAQIRQYKIKMSQFETNSQINNKIGQKYRALERKTNEFEDLCKQLKSENQNLINNYPFKRQDLEKAVNDARNAQKKIKEEQMKALEEECNKTITAKTQRLEQQLLDVYNQNNRIRSDLQVTLEENGRQKGRIAELEMLCEKVNALQSENELTKIALDEVALELKKKNQRISKNQIMLEGLESQNNLKDRQIQSLKNRIRQLEAAIQKLNGEIKSRKNAEKELQQALIRASDKKGQEKNELEIVYKQRQTQIVKQFETKIASLEAELKKMKQKQAKGIEQNANKMKILQQKMDEMEQAMKEKEKAIESHYQTEIQQLQNSLIKLSEQLKEKHHLIDQLNEAILVLEGDNVELQKQIQNTNYKHLEDRDLLQNQLSKLKSKMKDTENAYSTNLKTLEEQLNKATQFKASSNTSNSRMRANDADERAAKRYEQKLKTKDKKIQELKDNIYTLEQTILKLKKKQAGYQTSITEIDKLRIIISQYEKDKKRVSNDFELQMSRHTDEVRQLKRQILRLKEEEQKSRLLAEEKLLENESIDSELKTIRQLYQELQKELDRRKTVLTMQMQEETSLQYQMRLQQSKINQFQERILDYLKTIKEYELIIKKKDSELKKNHDQIDNLKRSEKNLKQEVQHQSQQLASLNKSLSEFNTSCESMKSELRFSRAEVNRLKKVQEDLKISNMSKEEMAAQLKRINDQLSNRYRNVEDYARKYSVINDRTRDQFGFNVQDLIEKYAILAEQKEIETNELIEEIEELKFLNERKYMDYDQIKKNNFELQLKVEEYQTLSDQLDTLRKVCDKLEDEKKNATFKEEVLRMQIQNLGVSGDDDLKSRIDSILGTPIVPSFANFSFY